MKKNTFLFAILLVTSSMSVQAAKSIGYWYDTAGDVVHNNFGECWRTISWNESNAIAECDKGKAKPMLATKKDVDSDNDGILDSKDQCPGTASGIKVDSSGCALNNDKDADGIVDSADKCPETASGAVVNKDGCKIKENISLKNVQFETGTAILSDDSRRILDNVAATLKENEHLNFEVAGHTDSAGNYQSNVRLSKQRADSVRNHLIAEGVAADRTVAKGYGPDKPVASNDTREGRSKNRRVELNLK